ncbi:uncharacterized protein LOC5501071 isoform X1 [Nematostella vectensis]|uniref:uncharacterized protein LOC5501071 isoform X1 n=1 Tax=Nematostella vectensis TaxID=45351 RepID=UPI0020776252|nr:uncharacterized protein LOC5501071 isoform X1 [Nematostella vectensis]
MALFESASKQFVKDTGRRSLHAVPDLNSSECCRILCVIERKKSRWFWRSTKYLTTPFVLNELLTEPVDLKEKQKEEVFITDYQNNPQFHVSGKLGAKIAKDLGIDVSTTDSFVVKMNIGAVNKTEIRWQDMFSALKGKRLNVDHEFVQAIIASKRRSLSVVCEMLATTGDTKMESELQVEGDADIETTGIPMASGKVEGSVKDSHQRSFIIPKGTVLGYGCYRLRIVDKDQGSLEIDIDKELEDKDVTDAVDGAPTAAHPFDQPDGQNDSALKSEFKTLLESPSFGKIIECFRNILASPGHIKPLRDLLEDSVLSLEGEKVNALKEDAFLDSMGPCQGWRELLDIIGFQFKEGKIQFPNEEFREIVLLCNALAVSLCDLSDAQCAALKDVTPDYLEPLLYLIRNAMYGRSTKEDDPQLKRIFTHAANPGKSFLLSLGFAQVTEQGSKVLALKPDPLASLEDIYVATFVMCQK